MLRILLICKFLNFFTVLTKKNPKFTYTLCVGDLISVLYIQPILPLIAFEEHYQVLSYCQLSVKVTLKNNGYWIFLIFFVFTLVYLVELEYREG